MEVIRYYNDCSSCLSYVIQNTNETTKHFHNSTRDSSTRTFCLYMLDRLNFASEGIQQLLLPFGTNDKLEYTIGITIRSVLLDYIILLNAMAIYGKYDKEENQLDWFQDMENYCLMHLSHGLHHSLDYIKDLKGRVNDEIIVNAYKNLYTEHADCFESYSMDGSEPILKYKGDYLSPKKMFRKMLASKDLKNAAAVYDFYLYYSKYDHFGSMFYTLSRNSALNKFKSMARSIKIFPKAYLFTVVILSSINQTDSFLTTKIDEAQKFIDELKDY